MDKIVIPSAIKPRLLARAVQLKRGADHARRERRIRHTEGCGCLPVRHAQIDGLTEEADRREARGARYQFELNKRWTIDGSPRWNVARYINHCCRPNAKPVGRRGGIVIVALRRIEPGEEITYDYGREHVKRFLKNGGCRCAVRP